LTSYDVERYSAGVIRSFRNREAEEVWHGKVVRRLPADIQRVARRKLRMLNNAQNLSDLRVPPGNRLEALRGDRAGQYGIRINEQWRICFEWRSTDAYEVEIVDDH
jgi:toxin HigB-1